jgi:hypothetical protein
LVSCQPLSLFIFSQAIARLVLTTKGLYDDTELFEQELATLALSPEEKWILIGVLAILGMFVVYFEIKYMKGKNKEVRRASVRKDEAFNAVLTTRSVANIMARQGSDTTKAQYLVDSAKQAMQAGNYERCMTLCEQARGELKGTPHEPAKESEEGDELEAVAESILTTDKRAAVPSDAYAGTKLPVDQDGSYLSAKFEINTAKADLSKARERGVETSQAESFLIEAETAYEAGSYSKALSMAVKARKSVSQEASKETIPLRIPREPEARKPGAGQAAPAKKAEAKCFDCSALLEPDDDFCGECGAKVARDRSCNVCGTKARPADKYCRKCGAEI